MSISTRYNPKEVEDKWYEYWLSQRFFHSEPNPAKEPYTIVIPPPNVTGVLHMGHMLNNTIQDVLIRKARMEGKEACWVPGTDHASIATEAKVVAMLKEQGIEKKDLTREEFLQHAWEWKNKYGGIILEQLKKLGASCDWERTYFTMDENLSDAVMEVFVRLYKKGYIYRGYRMVNWDPQGQTALSDDEVFHREVNTKLYYIRYQVEGEEGFVTIATVRPETILGDTAVCIHPEDERYKHLKGKRVLIPLINRPIPIIEDEYVSMEFGTGCLKVTPAHDPNDYTLGMKHKLAFIDILDDKGALNEKAQLYVGKDRFVVRREIAKDLEKEGCLVKVEDYQTNVGFSERTDAVVEPKISLQWFLKMDEITKPALQHVMNDDIRLYPSKFKNMYRSWMENVHDWCISRQLWWGHRIPAYYIDDEIIVAKTAEEALTEARQKTGKQSLTIEDLRQEEDILDTWFSSWLLPVSVFDGIKNPDNQEFKYYYPTNELVTAPEILFFWVARMIMAGYEFGGGMPFKNVYLTGIVRDKQGRKMSKSLGNSPDPFDLIGKYGADGLRTGMLFSSPAGNDLLFDEKLCEQGRNFTNKIWNAFRLIKGWDIVEDIDSEEDKAAIDWFEARLYASLEELEDHFSKFRISDALMVVYQLIWNEFCSLYLEVIKPKYGEAIGRSVYEKTLLFFEKLMKLLHPFMPFITEELWHQVRDREEKDCIIIAPWPQKASYDASILDKAEIINELITRINSTLKEKAGIDKKKLKLFIKTQDEALYTQFENFIRKLGHVSEMSFTHEKPEDAVHFVIKSDEFFIPVEGAVDKEMENAKLKEELAYTRGFLQSVSKKLENERFVSNAPAEVVARERQKKADAEAKIKALEESLGL